MPQIMWSDKYCTGINSIDQQHKQLVAMMNELDYGISEGQSKDAVGRALAGLINYTEKHFKYEEDLFDQTGYPLSEDHIKEHEALKKRVYDMKEEFEADQSGFLSAEVVIFLRDWLFNHIQGTDKRYVDHFKQNDVA